MLPGGSAGFGEQGTLTLPARPQQELSSCCGGAEQNDARCLEMASYRQERVGEGLPATGLCLCVGQTTQTLHHPALCSLGVPGKSSTDFPSARHWDGSLLQGCLITPKNLCGEWFSPCQGAEQLCLGFWVLGGVRHWFGACGGSLWLWELCTGPWGERNEDLASRAPEGSLGRRAAEHKLVSAQHSDRRRYTQHVVQLQPSTVQAREPQWLGYSPAKRTGKDPVHNHIRAHVCRKGKTSGAWCCFNPGGSSIVSCPPETSPPAAEWK